MTGMPAARLGDTVSHTDSAFGFDCGGLLGLAAGALLVGATIATGGAALAVVAAVGGAVAMTGGGALMGMNIGATYGEVTGDIATASPTIIINTVGAARAVTDVADCDHHDGPQLIATGSTTVFFNGMPAARLGDHTVCDARISSASPNVIIGGGTGQYAAISAEVSPLAVAVAKDMLIGGTAVALGAGAGAAFASAGWAGVGVFGLQSAGAIGLGAAGSVAGGAIGGAIDPVHGAAWGQAIGGVGGGALGGAGGSALGGESGLSDAAAGNVNKATAQDFYAAQGWPQGRIDSHMAGIDFTQPVSVTTLPHGTELSQWQVPAGSQGNYFAPTDASPGQLGISSVGYDQSVGAVSKVQTNYVSTEPTSALSSTAAAVNDTWSNPYSTAETQGGGQQYFVPNKTVFVPK